MAALVKFRKFVLEKAKQCFSERDYETAFSHYLLLIKLDRSVPKEILDEFITCMCQWTGFLNCLDQHDEVTKAFSQAKAACEHVLELMLALGEQAIRLKYWKTAVNIARSAMASFPDSLKVAELWEQITYGAMDRWHFKMLNDRQRNESYLRAIKHAVQTGNISSVLDVGCGTGLLSVFAEQCGVKEVVLCDECPVMMEICTAVIEDNVKKNSAGSAKTLLLGARSTMLSVPRDLPEKVDLVVTEIFDAALFGEHCLSTLNHAWRHLIHNDVLKKGRVIPGAAQIYFCAIECPSIRKENYLANNNIPLLDLTGVGVVSRTTHGDGGDEPYTTEDLFHIRGSYKFLSPIHTLLKVDFNDQQNMESVSNHQSELLLDIYSEGTLDAIAVWFDLKLFENISISTAPSDTCCWEQAIFPVWTWHTGMERDITEGAYGSPCLNCGDQLKLACKLTEGRLSVLLRDIVPLGYFMNSCSISSALAAPSASSCVSGKPSGQLVQSSTLSTAETVPAYKAPGCDWSSTASLPHGEGADTLVHRCSAHHISGSVWSQAGRQTHDAGDVESSVERCQGCPRCLISLGAENTVPHDRQRLSWCLSGEVSTPGDVGSSVEKSQGCACCLIRPGTECSMHHNQKRVSGEVSTSGDIHVEGVASAVSILDSLSVQIPDSSSISDTVKLQNGVKGRCRENCTITKDLKNSVNPSIGTISCGHLQLDGKANLRNVDSFYSSNNTVEVDTEFSANHIDKTFLSTDCVTPIQSATDTSCSHSCHNTNSGCDRYCPAKTHRTIEFVTAVEYGVNDYSGTSSETSNNNIIADVKQSFYLTTKSSLDTSTCKNTLHLKETASPVTIKETLHSQPTLFYLHREEIRHLNDHKFHSLCLMSMQQAISAMDVPSRIIQIATGPPILGLMALKLGIPQADFCYTGPSERAEVEKLTDIIWRRSGLRGQRWNWWEAGVSEMAEEVFQKESELLDLAVLDVVSMNGALHAGLPGDLRALRPYFKESGIVVPQVIDVYAVLIQSPHLLSMSCVTSDDNTLGVHIAHHINPFQTHTFLDIDIHALPHENLTDVAHVFQLDLQSYVNGRTELWMPDKKNAGQFDNSQCNSSAASQTLAMFSQSKRLHLSVRQSGRVTAVVFWFDLTLGQGLSASTIDPDMQWQQAAYILNSDWVVEKGEVAVLDAWLESSYMHFSPAKQSNGNSKLY